MQIKHPKQLLKKCKTLTWQQWKTLTKTIKDYLINIIDYLSLQWNDMVKIVDFLSNEL